MLKKMGAATSLLSIALLFSACVKTIEIVDSEKLIGENNYHWATIYKAADGTLYAGGGKTWTEGVIAEMKEDEWNITFRAPTAQILTFAEANGLLYATGMLGYRHFYKNDQWQYRNPVLWKNIQNLLPFSDTLIAVGGSRTMDCAIYSVRGTYLSDWELITDSLPTYPYAACNYDNKIIVCGYGFVFISNNRGGSWKEITPEHGLYKDIQIVDSTIFMMHDKGGVFRREIDESEWHKIHPSQNGSRFNGIYFYSTEIGYMVGDEGLIVHTLDGGDSWQTHQIESEHVLNDLYRKEEQLYIAGNEGLLIRIDAF